MFNKEKVEKTIGCIAVAVDADQPKPLRDDALIEAITFIKTMTKEELEVLWESELPAVLGPGGELVAMVLGGGNSSEHRKPNKTQVDDLPFVIKERQLPVPGSTNFDKEACRKILNEISRVSDEVNAKIFI